MVDAEALSDGQLTVCGIKDCLAGERDEADLDGTLDCAEVRQSKRTLEEALVGSGRRGLSESVPGVWSRPATWKPWPETGRTQGLKSETQAILLESEMGHFRSWIHRRWCWRRVTMGSRFADKGGGRSQRIPSTR